MNKLIDTLMKDESGAALIEYALLAALIAVVSIAVITSLGQGITGELNNMNSAVTR